MKTLFFLFLFSLLLFGDSATDLPAQLLVTSGDVQIELSARHFWNLNGIWFRGRMVCQKNKGFYGTVLAYKGLGWVGTGHLENKIGEKEVTLEFLADGKPIPPGQNKISAKTFSLKKTSRLHQARLHYELLLENNQLREQVTLEAIEESEIGVLYHFMHPWESCFQEFVLQGAQTPAVKQVFSAENERKFVWEPMPTWAALYDPTAKLSVLSVVHSERPLGAEPQWLMWNRGRDRKLYYVPGKKIKHIPGSQSDAVMLTCFIDCEPSSWVEQAAALAAELSTGLKVTP